MAGNDPVLASPPVDPRALELWLQHGAGYILFRNVRDYARGQIDPRLDAAARSAAETAIDDALYGLMMVIEGVPAPLRNDDHRLELEMTVRLSRHRDDTELASMNLAEGDGMCMGYHGWVAGDFGDDPIIVPDRVSGR